MDEVENEYSSIVLKGAREKRRVIEDKGQIIEMVLHFGRQCHRYPLVFFNFPHPYPHSFLRIKRIILGSTTDRLLIATQCKHCKYKQLKSVPSGLQRLGSGKTRSETQL